MPQDHASWDRKELLRQRKHERPEQSFDSPFRWRDSPSTPSSHHLPREFSRWGSGDFRRPCHGKQGGRHQFVEETGHGYTSSRSSARMFENDYYRPSASRGDWRYTRNFRDDRVSVSQKDWKCNTWEMSNGSSRSFERPCGIRNGRRSVDERPLHASDTHTTVVNSLDPANSTPQPDTEICTPVRTLKFKNEQKLSDQRLSPHSDCVSLFERPSSENNYGKKGCSPAKQCNDLMYSQRLANDNSLDLPIHDAELEGTWEKLHLKNPQDNKFNGIGDDLDGARRCAKESSLGAIGKLPVWTRSGSFASQNSGYSHSSSLKSLGAVDSSEQKFEVLPKIVTVTQSSSGEATACATTTHLSEEMSSRKKQRLGWGEGLAKYEKKKVDVNINEDGTTLGENGTEEDKNIADKSPTVAIVPDYGSPTTPSSVACSSSPEFADKSSAKAAVAASDVSNTCRSPSPVTSIHPERFPINIEELDNISMERFGCLLNELIGTDDPGSGDSSSVQLTSMNRLLAWKCDILKAVEMTESEIDLLENKHRTLKLEGGRHCRVVELPSSHFCEGDVNVPKEQEATCILGPKAAASSVDETLVRASVHQAVSAKVPVDVFEDSPGEINSLSQSFATVESNEDMLPIPSMKAATSSNENITSAFTNQEAIELSSADDDSMASNEDLLCAKLLSSNKKYASESSGVFNELLSRDFSSFDDSRFPAICQTQFDSRVKEKIADRIELLRAREKILLLQFKAFQLSWKKDLQQLALTKYQSKSSKKAELYPNAKNGGHLRVSQPVRLRFSSSAPRRDSLAPTTELVSYMEKLLPGTHLKPFRDILRMPAMILDEKERVKSRFISSNGLIEDPCDVEKERTMINPWTSEEKETFLNMLAIHGKDFKKIASYLTQKTTADCIDYYYKNHKSDSFGKMKKQRAFGKEGKHTYMLAPRKKWKREIGAASLDILGAVSIIAANAGKVASTRQISSKRVTLRGCSSSNSLQHDGNNSEGCSYSFDFPRKRPVGADVLAVGPLSSEQINYCVRTSVSSGERCMDHLKFNPVVKKPRISHTTHNENNNEEDDSCSEESCGETGPIHWTDDERSAFIQGFSLFGKNFASISRFVGTRSQDQCRVFYSKVRKCLGLEFIQSGSGNVSTSASVDNGNEGGGSDLEDPCAMESNSGICNNGVCAKMGLNSPTSPFNMNQDGANHSGSANVKADLSISEQENGLTYLHLKDGTNLENDACINGGFPALVSESCRDLGVNTVESQCQATGKSMNNDLLSMEIDEESPRKSSGGQGAAMPNHTSKNQAGVMQVVNRTRNSSLEAEPGFRYPDCLHHVPIELYTGNPIGVSVPRGNPNCHTDSESGNSLVGQVVETHNLGWQCSKVNLNLDERLQVLVHVNPEQNGQPNVESCQIRQRSFTQDLSRISRSKSDLIVKSQRTGEGFSLNKCTSLAAKPLAVSHKEGRSGHSRSHSFSLSDTQRHDKNGDVKLFGTLLTADENGIKQKQNQCTSVRSSSTLSTDHDTRHQYINNQHLQNVPITSYGFWDGNRIQTGLTSLPESAKLLASCPEAFSMHLKQQVGNGKEIQVDVSSGIMSFGKHNEDSAEASSAMDEGNVGGGVNGVAEAAT
ncbi:hypothetical protein V5N11_013111 [Cardamine amara subsp. amara]|uniref:SANT domain-containing protein n=1 Tax=Cardamine amara subsp. amara TaxID=228776 RepID=A0ABD0ZZ27_CARAN